MTRDCFNWNDYLDTLKPACEAIKGCESAMCLDNKCTAQLPSSGIGDRSFETFRKAYINFWLFLFYMESLVLKGYKLTLSFTSIISYDPTVATAFKKRVKC